MAAEFYVYRIFDGAVTVYIGKGSGKRLEAQKRRFGCDGEIIERCRSDDHAFERERHWIASLKPTDNISPGGNGGRCKPKRVPRKPKEYLEMERVGLRRYAARFLLTKLDESNCEQHGISPAAIVKLRNVANSVAIL